MISLQRAGAIALDLLYPLQCRLCRRTGAALCAECVAKLPRADGPRCERCWLPLRAVECARCAEHPLALDGLRSAFRYEGDLHKLVHSFKYGGVSSLAPALAGALAESLGTTSVAVDYLVPVPLTRAHERQRGFNQAALLARELGKRLDLPALDALERRGRNVHQAGSLTAEERWRNVDGVFHTRPDAAIAGRSFLLIDDVATTGATLDACARALLAAGATVVGGLTLSRQD